MYFDNCTLKKSCFLLLLPKMWRIQLFLRCSSMLLTTVVAANGPNGTADVSVQSSYHENLIEEPVLDSNGDFGTVEPRRRDQGTLLIVASVVVAVLIVLHSLTAAQPSKESFGDTLEEPQAGRYEDAVSNFPEAGKHARHTRHTTLVSLQPSRGMGHLKPSYWPFDAHCCI